MEALGRGVVAVRSEPGKVFVSWRLLADDPESVGFNVYRQTDGGESKRLNPAVLQGPTFFIDESADPTQAQSYAVRAVVKGREREASRAFVLPPNAPTRSYLPVPLKTPQGYSPNDGSVGDLDGDGE